MAARYPHYVFNAAKSHPRKARVAARLEPPSAEKPTPSGPIREGDSMPAPRESALHLGLRVNGGKYGLRLTRDAYALVNKRCSLPRFERDEAPDLWEAVHGRFEDEDHRFYTDAWCEAQRAVALENFDLNMAYFASLDHADFDTALKDAVAAHPGMVEVTDLSAWRGKKGLYVMVLDDYCQAYVGTTSSEGGIGHRVRQHWAGTKAFDRLLWGSVSDSILSIDSFRAFDTTRVFAARARDPISAEDRLIESFPAKYLLNRIVGGRAEMLSFLTAAGIDVQKRRALTE